MVTFEKVYDDHHSNIFNWINSKIRDNETSEELANDVFMKVHNNITSYDAEISKVSTWVYNIAKNVLIDYLRKKKLHTFSIDEIENDENKPQFVHTDGKDGHSEMVNSELSIAIMTAMDSLPETYKPVADLFFIQEKSHDEIVNILNIPKGTVKGYIHRAKEALRSKLINLR